MAQTAQTAQTAQGAGATGMGRAEQDFVPLFDGKTLSGWELAKGDLAHWSVDGEEVRCNGERPSGWIRTARMYHDFALRLQYAIAPDGNSGIFARSLLEGRPAYNGMEFQILDDHGTAPTKTCTGSMYDAVAPSKNLARKA